MKLNINILIIILFLHTIGKSQGTTMTYVSGSRIGAVGSYVVKGNYSASDTPPGLSASGSWIDNNGKFWIFGGIGGAGFFYGDLWKYDPANNIWGWMKGPGGTQNASVYGTRGVEDTANHPGARCRMATWTGSNGDLWLYGGSLYQYGCAGDLWKFNTATNNWIWINGAAQHNQPTVYGVLQQSDTANTPGGRSGCTTWSDDAGNLWLFGGADGLGNLDNDLWKYDITTGTWTWMKGSQLGSNLGSFGVKGVENSANLPSPRINGCAWKDAIGNFYLMGGGGQFYGQNYSDVWKFNLSTNNWIWVGGDSAVGSAGQGNQLCTDTGNRPVARIGISSIKFNTCTNAGLMFGGAYHATPWGYDDLWLYNFETNNWRCLSNSAIGNGSYGGGAEANMFLDSTGTLWLFGGQGSININYYCEFNSVWKYAPDVCCTHQSFNGHLAKCLADSVICPGHSTTLQIFGGSNLTITPANSVTIIDSETFTLHPSSTTTYVITGKTACYSHDTISITLPVHGTDHIQYSLTPTALCPGDTAVLTLGTRVNTQNSFPINFSYWKDSTHEYLFPQTHTTFNIITQFFCNTDTVNTTLDVLSDSSFNLSRPFICKGDSAMLIVNGGAYNLNLSPQYNIAYIDSYHVAIFPDTTTVYTFLSKNCNGIFGSHIITINVTSPGKLNYAFPDSVECVPGNLLLILEGVTNSHVQPYNLYYQPTADSVYLLVNQTTTFQITGTSPCRTVDTTIVTGYLNPPYYDNYPFAPCIGDSIHLTLYNINNVSILPPYGLLFVDSADMVLYGTVDTTYYISGTSDCGTVYLDSFSALHEFPLYQAYDSIACANPDALICILPWDINVTYTYQWSTGDSAQCIYTSQPAVNVTITDNYNCTALSNFNFPFNQKQGLCAVSADTTSTQNIVIWEKADKYGTDSFYLYRTVTPDTSYLQIATISKDSLSEYFDLTALASQFSYRYKISIKDTCGVYRGLSNYHQTIYLQYMGQGNFQWTPYVIENTANPVNSYNLYRDSFGGGVWQLITTVSNTQNSVSDTGSYNFPNAQYKVTASLNTSCNAERALNTITSNIISHLALSLPDVLLSNIRLAPNPATDQFQLFSTNEFPSIKAITMHDQLGRELPVTYVQRNKNIVVSLSGFASGLYYVRIYTESDEATFKLVKY